LRLEAITIEKKRKEAVTRRDFTSNKKKSVDGNAQELLNARAFIAKTFFE
jgi:hypothetical protein